MLRWKKELGLEFKEQIGQTYTHAENILKLEGGCVPSLEAGLGACRLAILVLCSTGLGII